MKNLKDEKDTQLRMQEAELMRQDVVLNLKLKEFSIESKAALQMMSDSLMRVNELIRQADEKKASPAKGGVFSSFHAKNKVAVEGVQVDEPVVKVESSCCSVM